MVYFIRRSQRWFVDCLPKQACLHAIAIYFVLMGTGCPAETNKILLEPCFSPPPSLAGDFGKYRSPLIFKDGRKVTAPAEWPRRRQEILADWHRLMGPWPPLLAKPAVQILRTETRDGLAFHRVGLEIAAGQTNEGWLLIPAGQGPFPAVLVPFYEPETSIGLGKPNRDFALQLARRGFVTLAIGSPGGDAWRPDTGQAICQPLSYLAYVAANCHTALSQRPEVDAARIGIVGHSYGGKWAMFAACLHEKFACAAWSDPGIAWDEGRPNVNYWEEWYLGKVAGQTRLRGVPTAENPRTGAYQKLYEAGHDLHELQALMAPRPFLVSGGAEDPPERWRVLNQVVAVNTLLGISNRVAYTSRPTHDPTPESNAILGAFFEHFLRDNKPR
jgi:hypothetical protein